MLNVLKCSIFQAFPRFFNKETRKVSSLLHRRFIANLVGELLKRGDIHPLRTVRISRFPKHVWLSSQQKARELRNKRVHFGEGHFRENGQELFPGRLLSCTYFIFLFRPHTHIKLSRLLGHCLTHLFKLPRLNFQTHFSFQNYLNEESYVYMINQIKIETSFF